MTNQPSTKAQRDVRTFDLLIGGQYRSTGAYEWFPHTDEYIQDFEGTTRLARAVNESGQEPPAAERHRFFARIALAGEAEVQQAIEAAYEASKRFTRTTLEERKALVLEIGRVFQENQADLLYLGQCEGRPKMTFEWEVNHHFGEKGTFVEDTLDFYIEQLRGEELNLFDRVTYFPFGVVGFVPPGNAPIYNGLAVVVGSLMAGNAMVVKPPRNRAAQTLRFIELCEEVAARHGFPGLFNTVIGDSREIMELWADSPLIDAVVFYGGSGLGLDVGAKLTRKGTKPILELAGSDAVVIWEDADVATATNNIFLTRFFLNAGQICIAPKRLFVHRKVYDEVVERLCSLVSAEWVMGLPSELDTVAPFLLPVFDIDRKLCIAAINDAKKRGKPILAGGRFLDHTGRENPDGVYLTPTIIGDVSMDMHCMRHEIFGPVLPIVVVDDLEQTIEYANDTIFGLRASFWSNSTEVAERFAEGVKTGSVFINDHSFYFNGKAPFLGGVKASGLTGAKYFHLELSVRRYIHHGRSLPFYHYNQGMDHLKHARLKDALREFEKALMLDANFAFGHYGKGLVHKKQGQHAEAYASFAQASALRQDQAEFFYELGMAAYACNALDEAIGHLGSALRCAPSLAKAHSNAGWMLTVAGRYAEAAEHLSQFLALVPDDPMAAKARELLAECQAHRALEGQL